MRVSKRPPPRKRFGQHFLEAAWVEKVVGAIRPSPADTFLEIGPGRGALTMPLAAVARRIVAVEIDRDLVRLLRDTVPPNVEIVEADFLDLRALPVAEPVRVAGNLPYNVASPILFKLSDLSSAGASIADATIMLQREVADRLLASPGSRDYGVLSVLIGYGAEVSRLFNLPPGAFRPPPKVDSSLVRLRFRPPAVPAGDVERLRAVVQAAFGHRRKTLANALKPLIAPSPVQAVLDRAALDGRRRPETLSVAEFVRLAGSV